LSLQSHFTRPRYEERKEGKREREEEESKDQDENRRPRSRAFLEELPECTARAFY